MATPPHAAIRDCSLGFCSMHCPQWCYFYFPPPPPSSHSSFSLSPLLIALLIVLSSAFFIVTAYIFALKYFTHHRRRFPATSSASIWLPPPPTGLDPSLINRLTTYRYRPGINPSSDGDARVDCPVCLGEFREGDSIRLLPKCAHAFHRSCIDTWLSSHSNCPLCRADILPPAENRTADTEEGEMEMARDSEAAGRRSPEERIGGLHEVAIEIREERDVVGTAAESSAGRSTASVAKSSVSSGRGSRGVVPL
ncbi:E3 ubiquitin-protein ligase [Platanthera guangdongensis]|uniref:RING-type E3 ubiquitin transferase n=1 Tax=Platanthera guangdongensis TaxID=2320717 RepID=A0ABR2LQC9_9ASPA